MNIMSESAQTSSSEHNETGTSTRRKKATRACFHCQKAHLTCDDCEYSYKQTREIKNFD